MKFTFVLGVIIGILVVAFILQNTEIVEISFLFWTISISRALMVLLVFIVGIIVGAIIKDIGARKKEKKKEKEPSR
jgi:uncharacterized integral membrane protein